MTKEATWGRVLQAAVAEQGKAVLSRPSFLSNLCADLAPDEESARHLLDTAAKFDVAAKLNDQIMHGIEPASAVATVAENLSRVRYLQPDVSRALVTEFARALGYQLDAAPAVITKPLAPLPEPHAPPSQTWRVPPQTQLTGFDNPTALIPQPQIAAQLPLGPPPMPARARRRRRLPTPLLATVGPLILVATVLIAVYASEHSHSSDPPPRAAGTAAGASTTSSSPTSSSTTAAPTKTNPIAIVSITNCPVDYVQQKPSTVPSLPPHIWAPIALKSTLSGYSDGYLTTLALAGWTCSGMLAEDGGLSLQAAPAGVPKYSPYAPSDEGVDMDYPNPQTGVGTTNACPYFASAQATGDCEGLTTKPTGEVVTPENPDIVLTEDPPGVKGIGAISGGDYPANSVLIWYPQSNYFAEETCTLPDSERSDCTAILNDFIERYGSRSS